MSYERKVGGGRSTMYGTEEGEWGYFQFRPLKGGRSFLEQPMYA